MYGLVVIFTRSLSLKPKLQTNPFKSGGACAVVYKVLIPVLLVRNILVGLEEQWKKEFKKSSRCK